MIGAWRPKHVEKVCSNKSASCSITSVFYLTVQVKVTYDVPKSHNCQIPVMKIFVLLKHTLPNILTKASPDKWNSFLGFCRRFQRMAFRPTNAQVCYSLPFTVGVRVRSQYVEVGFLVDEVALGYVSFEHFRITRYHLALVPYWTLCRARRENWATKEWTSTQAPFQTHTSRQEDHINNSDNVGLCTLPLGAFTTICSPFIVVGRSISASVVGVEEQKVLCGAFNNLSTWVRKKQLITKKYFFIFQCSPLITQYTSPTFVATTLSPWKKKIFWLLFKSGRDRLLDFFIAWKSFTQNKFFHNSE